MEHRRNWRTILRRGYLLSEKEKSWHGGEISGRRRRWNILWNTSLQCLHQPQNKTSGNARKMFLKCRRDTSHVMLTLSQWVPPSMTLNFNSQTHHFFCNSFASLTDLKTPYIFISFGCPFFTQNPLFYWRFKLKNIKSWTLNIHDIQNIQRLDIGLINSTCSTRGRFDQPPKLSVSSRRTHSQSAISGCIQSWDLYFVVVIF